MPLMPERVKYRKMHRCSRAGLATRGHTVAFGEYGLMALERCWLDTKQLEAARVAIARNMKRHGKMWIRVAGDGDAGDRKSTRLNSSHSQISYAVFCLKKKKKKKKSKEEKKNKCNSKRYIIEA